MTFRRIIFRDTFDVLMWTYIYSMGFYMFTFLPTYNTFRMSLCDITLWIFCIPWDTFFSKYNISGVWRWISPKVQLNRHLYILWIFTDYTLNRISKMLKYLMIHSHTIAVYCVPRTWNVWPGKWYTEIDMLHKFIW